MTYILAFALIFILGLFSNATNLQSLWALQRSAPKQRNRSTTQPPVNSKPSTCKGQPSVEISDPAGDVKKGEPDVIKASLGSDGENMLVAVELKEEVAPIFTNLLATDVLELYLDTDCRDTTGGKLVFTERRGFEYATRIGVCITYESPEGKGELDFCGGGLKGGKIKSFSSGLRVEKYDQDGGYSKSLKGSSMGSFGSVKLPRGTVNGNRIEVAIPYTILGVRSGQTVRISAKEYFESSLNESIYSPDVFLMFK